MKPFQYVRNVNWECLLAALAVLAVSSAFWTAVIELGLRLRRYQ